MWVGCCKWLVWWVLLFGWTIAFSHWWWASALLLCVESGIYSWTVLWGFLSLFHINTNSVISWCCCRVHLLLWVVELQVSEIESYPGSCGPLGTLCLSDGASSMVCRSQWLRTWHIICCLISRSKGCVVQILCHCERFDSCFLLISIPIYCIFAAMSALIIRLEQSIEDIQLLLGVFSRFQAFSSWSLVVGLLLRRLCSSCLLRFEIQLRYIPHVRAVFLSQPLTVILISISILLAHAMLELSSWPDST